MTLPRRDGFGSCLEPVRVGMNTELVPVCLGEIHVVVLRGLFYVGERQGPILVRDLEYLVEPCDSIAHVLGIGERLFPLFRESENVVGQVASGREMTVFLVWFPSCFDGLISYLPS